MRKLMARGVSWPPALEFRTKCARSNAGGIDTIREWAYSVTMARLVIVDVLAMFKPLGKGKDAYGEDYAAIKALQELAAELGIAILVIHHTRKSQDQADPFEKVSGTLGLSGAADSTLILSREALGVTLYGRGRDIPEIETAVAFDRETCTWRIMGEASEVHITAERKAILSFLIEATESRSPQEISTGAGLPRNNTDQLLFKMARDGDVLKSGRGHYIHPSRADLTDKKTDLTDKKIRNGHGAA